MSDCRMESFVKVFTILVIIHGASCTAPESLDFYSLTAKDIQGNEMSLEQYKGQVRQKHRSMVTGMDGS